MDDTQTAFATQYPSYGFDLDMMKVHLLFFHLFSLLIQSTDPITI